MTQTKIPSDLFRKLIKQREDNTEALEKREKGDFVVKRFTPLNEKKIVPLAPGNTEDAKDDDSRST